MLRADKLSRRAASAFALLTLAIVTGCSSSGGGGGVSQAQLVAKLQKDPQIKQLETQAGASADKVKTVIPCMASALQKDADAGDLKKYVDGKLNLGDLGGKTKGAAQKAATTVRRASSARRRRSGAAATSARRSYGAGCPR